MQHAAATLGRTSPRRESRVRGQSKLARERVVELLLVLSGLISVLTTAGILYVLISLATLTSRSVRDLPRRPSAAPT